MDVRTRIQALGGMILATRDTSEETRFMREFLQDMKATLEMQEAKIEQLEQEVEHLRNASHTNREIPPTFYE